MLKIGKSRCALEAGRSCLASPKAMGTHHPRTGYLQPPVSGQNANRQRSGLGGWSLSWVCAQCVFTTQVGTQFKNSLSNLLELLTSKEPSYIRCIKPNERKEPSESPTRRLWNWGWGGAQQGAGFNLKATTAVPLNMNSNNRRRLGCGSVGEALALQV